MSYIARLRTSIQLTSPDGDFFEAKWIGNERSKEKKIGVFEYPNNNGTITQDLGINGSRYPITISFDGEDNDLEAERFYNACDQRGTWEVLHPTKGMLTLQLSSVTERIQPVESGITEFDTQWIQPLPPTSTASSAQTASQVQQDAEDTNIAAAEQYDNSLSLDTASEALANESAISRISDAVSNTIGSITERVSEISSQYLAIRRGIQDTLDQPVLDALSLAGQVQQLIQLPALVTDDIQARLDLYSDLANELFPFLPGGISAEDKNTATALELGLTGTIVGACQSIVTGILDNRTQALAYAEFISNLLAEVCENLDSIQDNFSDNDISAQYFSNSIAYNNLAIIVGRTLTYLIDSLLSLKIEKRFILKKPRAPLEITVTEYGSLGDNDENLDFFITTNELTGNEVRLLNAGREVVVYV